jgi:hypothetical protein
MKIIKVLYNKETDFILNIVAQFQAGNIIELFDADIHTNLKKIRPMQVRFGSKNYPLIIFENHNLEEVFAIWSEANPDWSEAINTYLQRDG